MKSINRISFAALAALALTACSNDELIQESGGNNQGTEDLTGTGFVNIAINLPSVSANAGRSQSNDVFDDGEASEYKVSCAHLVVFKSSSANDEATAEVAEVYELNGLKPWNTDGSTDNVTATAQMVQQIQQAPADNLWMMIVLNDPEAMTHFRNGTTFQALTNNAATYAMTSDKGIYMTNAPLYKDGKVTTLTKLNRNNIYPSETEAKAAAAVDVYVERGVAKITVSATEAAPSVDIDGTKYVASISAWGLDITNKSTYMVRNTSVFGDWAKLSKSARFYSTATNRVYWAVDPNYTDFHADDFDRIEENDVALGLNQYAYCLENTFNVRNMRQDRTTRVVIKTAFKPQNAATAATFYTIGTGSTIYDKDGMQTLIKAKAIELLSGKTDASKYTFSTSTSVSATAGAHQIEVNDIYYDGTALTASEVEQLNDAIGTIQTYLNGECFYVARIQHFGQTYTPWNEGDPTYGEVSETTRPEAENNYLGRYGVVRNNWYELQVTGIKGLGTPVIPDPKDTPDDENKYYISFKVNMHSWAKRVQDIVLQ